MIHVPVNLGLETRQAQGQRPRWQDGGSATRVLACSALEAPLGNTACEEKALRLAFYTTEPVRLVDSPEAKEREIEYANALRHAMAVSVSKTMDEDGGLKAADREATEAMPLLSKAIEN